MRQAVTRAKKANRLNLWGEYQPVFRTIPGSTRKEHHNEHLQENVKVNRDSGLVSLLKRIWEFISGLFSK